MFKSFCLLTIALVNFITLGSNVKSLANNHRKQTDAFLESCNKLEGLSFLKCGAAAQKFRGNTTQGSFRKKKNQHDISTSHEATGSGLVQKLIKIRKTLATSPVISNNWDQKRRSTNYRLSERTPMFRYRRSLSKSSIVCKDEVVSCRNKCGYQRKSIYEEKATCYCDVNCEFYQDCCADYNTFCSRKASENIALTKNITQNVTNVQGNGLPDKDLWKCFDYPKIDRSTLKGIWMIGSCRTSWPKDDIFYQCRSLSDANKITKDNYNYLPVYTSNGTVYHNRFCAQCNGVDLIKTKSYQLSMDCKVLPPKHLTFSEKVAFLFTYCIKFRWEPLSVKIPRRYCLVLNTDCKLTSLNKQCKEGPVRLVTDRWKLYRNMYCAECNGLSRVVVCGPTLKHTPEIAPPPKPMSLILDMRGDSTDATVSEVKCPLNNVYDHYLETCRETLPTFSKSSTTTQYEVAIWFTSTKALNLTESNSNKEIAKAIQVAYSQVTSSVLKIKKDLYMLRFKLQVTETSSSSTFLQLLLHFTSPFNITIADQTVTVFKSSERVVSCANIQVFKRDEYTMHTNDQSVVIIKSSGELLQSREYSTEKMSANESREIYVCRLNNSFNCSGSWALMKEGEFKFLNKSVIVNGSKLLYNISQYIWQKGNLYVCENFTNVKFVKQGISKTDYNILSKLTLVCMSISVIALVFVLVTYSLFSELRTPPGINLMNLSVSILLGQLLWLVGSGRTDNPMACTVIAVLLHYFFLVSLVWTSIIAFDTWKAFTAKGTRSLASSKRLKLMHRLRYMAVGWVPVAVYVAICLALDQSDFVVIGYGKHGVCWLGTTKGKLYFFAIPFVLILLNNIVLYILTMKAINATAAQASVATDHKHRKQSFGISVRIASTMGFTWIFSLLALLGLDFLWYPHVVFNGLQGVHIALAFGFNQRSRKLYKRLFNSAALPGRNNTTSTKDGQFSISRSNESRL